jgi:hypothetical protein
MKSVFGIWNIPAKRWLMDADGEIIHSEHLGLLRARLAQTSTLLNSEEDLLACQVKIIDKDGNPKDLK